MKASDKKIKREEPLSVELMIATVSQNDDSVLDRMHVQSDAVVINQGSPFQWQEFRQVMWKKSGELSRNIPTPMLLCSISSR